MRPASQEPTRYPRCAGGCKQLGQSHVLAASCQTRSKILKGEMRLHRAKIGTIASGGVLPPLVGPILAEGEVVREARYAEKCTQTVKKLPRLRAQELELQKQKSA